jgi:hypothetical protein
LSNTEKNFLYSDFNPNSAISPAIRRASIVSFELAMSSKILLRFREPPAKVVLVSNMVEWF